MISRVPFTGDLMILSIHLFTFFTHTVSWAQAEASRSLPHSPIQSLGIALVSTDEPGYWKHPPWWFLPSRAYVLWGLYQMDTEKGWQSLMGAPRGDRSATGERVEYPPFFLREVGADVQREPEMRRLGGTWQTESEWLEGSAGKLGG